jgi:hypothetical protein
MCIYCVSTSLHFPPNDIAPCLGNSGERDVHLLCLHFFPLPTQRHGTVTKITPCLAPPTESRAHSSCKPASPPLPSYSNPNVILPFTVTRTHTRTPTHTHTAFCNGPYTPTQGCRPAAKSPISLGYGKKESIQGLMLNAGKEPISLCARGPYNLAPTQPLWETVSHVPPLAHH